jgi:hypothetical protein
MLVPLLFQIPAEIIVDTETGRIVDYILIADEPLFFKVGRTVDLSDESHYELVGRQLVPACPQVRMAKAQTGSPTREEEDRAINIALDTEADFGTPHICIGALDVS